MIFLLREGRREVEKDSGGREKIYSLGGFKGILVVGIYKLYLGFWKSLKAFFKMYRWEIR